MNRPALTKSLTGCTPAKSALWVFAFVAALQSPEAMAQLQQPLQPPTENPGPMQGPTTPTYQAPDRTRGLFYNPAQNGSTPRHHGGPANKWPQYQPSYGPANKWPRSPGVPYWQWHIVPNAQQAEVKHGEYHGPHSTTHAGSGKHPNQSLSGNHSSHVDHSHAGHSEVESVEVSNQARIDMRLRVEPASVSQINGLIVIPTDAVVEVDSQQYLFVENGELFQRVPVTVVARNSSIVSVANNGQIFPGESIAVSGTAVLQTMFKNKSVGGNDVDPHAGHAHKSPGDIPRPLTFADAERLAKNNVASTQEQLAQLYIDFAHYEDAIEQLEVVMAHFATESSLVNRYAVAANRLARVYLELGRFSEAKRLLVENVEKLSEAPFDASLTSEPSDTLGDTLALQAEFYRETGDFKQAETLHTRILKRRRELFGEDHREYAVALHNFGIFKWRQERYQYAEELLRRELQITEQLSPNSRDLTHSRESLALALTSLGKLSEAETLLRSALQGYRESYGSKRDEYRTLSNLAYLHIFDGKHDEALKLFTEAANGRRDLLGEDHLDYADTLADAARLRLASGNFSQAITFSRHSLAITRKNLELTSTAQSERQQLAMASLFRERLDLLLTAAANDPNSAEQAFTEVLAWKGSTLVRQRAMRTLSQQVSTAEQYKKLQQITMRLASLSRFLPSDSEAISQWKATLTALTNEKESLEAELSQTSAEFRASQSQPSLESLVGALPDDAVLIDYFQYDSLSPDPTQGRFHRTPSMMASIVKADGSVHAVYFGSTTEIANDIDLWREDFGVSPASRDAGQRLRKTLWEPLLPTIGGAAILLVSTDGPLGRLPLSALPGREEGSYLIEDHRIAMVPVPQLIPMIANRGQRRDLPKHLLVMGDVDYGDPTQALLAVNDAPTPLPWDRRGLSRARAGHENFKHLEHTAGEIAAIERLYKNQLWSKDDGMVTLDRRNATEQRFRELAPQCYQLHLATHGFFAAPEVTSDLDNLHGVLADRLGGDADFTMRGISPGLLSGLAFSGANAAPTPDQDDGILTADEIAFLPLDGVELVVLSACETGLGEVAGGEGLLGIQRSFQVSGARTTVASLWQVPDLATRLLMEQFYKNYWSEKMSRLDAMRAAQLWVLNHPDELRGVVRESKDESSRKTPPKYWGAFVLSGDWR